LTKAEWQVVDDLMKSVLFIQNGEFEGPGLLASVLRGCGVAVETVHAWRGDAVPDLTADWDAIAIGGGSMSAYELREFTFLEDEIALLKHARTENLPLLGLCLGAQLMAAAFGGDVFPNRGKEIGFFELEFTGDAARDPLWQPVSAGPFRPVSWHGDAFSLPRGAVRLARSALTENQLFSLDRIHYGLQFHLEIDRPLLAQMVATDDAGGLPHHGIDPGQFLREAELALPAVEQFARGFFARWTKLETDRGLA
jgi:GMP synthase-like glutamine amidotransferase